VRLLIISARLFEDIFREMEASIRNLRLFEDIFKRIEAFLR
jgi:hypothetical protein